MLTVPEAARRVGRNPETVRRWIREGRLPARKIGTQHFIEEAAIDDMATPDEVLPLPPAWRTTYNGQPMPNWVGAVRRNREGH